jgi:surface protein
MSSWDDLYDNEGHYIEKTGNLDKLFICISLILMFGNTKDALNVFKTSRRFSPKNKNLLERIKENEYSHRLDDLGYQRSVNTDYIERGPFSRLNLNWKNFVNPPLIANYSDREEATKLFGPIESWDVSKVENMEGLFKNMKTFNEDISGWDVSNVTNMKSMFEGCTEFNQPIGNWDVSNVKFMKSMFKNCTNFNQSLQNWDVRSLIDCGSNSKQFNRQVFNNCRIQNELKPKFN